MPMIKTMASANQICASGLAMCWDGLAGGDKNNPTSVPHSYMRAKSSHGLMGIDALHLHSRSGCVAELGAGSWVFLSPVPPSFSGH